MLFKEDFDDSSNNLLAEINMIPLIDVMLVLLVLFIITAPLLIPYHLWVEIPEVTSINSVPIATPVELTINKQGELFWQGIPIDDAKFVTHLNAFKQQTASPQIQLQADKTLPYQRVIEILSIIQNAGITQIAFVVEPLNQ